MVPIEILRFLETSLKVPWWSFATPHANEYPRSMGLFVPVQPTYRHSGGFKGGKGVQMHPPLAASNVFLRTYLHESTAVACSKQQPGTDTHSHTCFLRISSSRRLSRPGVASRYSVRTSSYSLASYDNNYVRAFMRPEVGVANHQNFRARFALALKATLIDAQRLQVMNTITERHARCADTERKCSNGTEIDCTTLREEPVPLRWSTRVD